MASLLVPLNQNCKGGLKKDTHPCRPSFSEPSNDSLGKVLTNFPDVSSASDLVICSSLVSAKARRVVHITATSSCLVGMPLLASLRFGYVVWLEGDVRGLSSGVSAGNP